MKKILLTLGVAATLLTACETKPFVANTTNNLLVGSWDITKVSNEAAAVTATELVTTVLAERFSDEYDFTFEEGANFNLNDAAGNEVMKGQYAISEDNKTLTLKIEGESGTYDFDIIGEGDKIAGFNSASAGETSNLAVTKK